MKTLEGQITARRGSITVIAAACLLAAMAAGSTASAGSGQQRNWTTVSGSAVPSACGGVYAAELRGDLEGCWAVFPEDFSCEELNGFALYKESGREEFEGTRNGEPGHLVTNYTFRGVYPSGFCSTFDFSGELAGSCDHYVKGRSGAFRGVVGLIQFYDIIPGIQADGNGNVMPGTAGPTDYFYVGTLNR